MPGPDDFEALYLALQTAQKNLLEAQKRSGGERMSQPYAFTTPDGRVLTLSQLFGDKTDLLVIHNMGEHCSYCMMWADALSSSTDHIASRSALWLTNNDTPAQLGAFQQQRAWRFPVASARGTSFTSDCQMGKPGDWWPGVSAFHKSPDGTITRVASSLFGPGDLFNPVWHLFALLHDGANGWKPARSYP
jgi:predicted dithiol-disulfide oxidoreductase (DUF899 family)